MKIFYVSSVNPNIKAGYFNAVVDRINVLRCHPDIDLISVNYSHTRDSFFDIHINKNIFLNQKVGFSLIENFYLYKKLYRLISKIKPDIVHVHWCYPIGFSTVLACRSTSTPCIVTCHGSDIHTYPLKYKRIFSRSLWTLHHASRIIFVSDELRRRATEIFGGINNVSIVGNSIDIKSLPRLSDKKPINNTLKKIGYIGNLNSCKGADMLPDIFQQISTKAKFTVEFYVAGNGPLYADISAVFLEKKLPVKMLGHIPRTDVFQLINDLDVLVICSRNEGFGIAALEAFILHTPCVAFDIDGLRSIFTANENLLVEAFSIQALTNRVIEVLNGQEKVNFSRYTRDYDISLKINEEIDIYKQLAHDAKVIE